MQVATADGATFGPKTMQSAYPALEIERPIVMGKGWLEFRGGYERKVGVGAWDSNGKVDKFDSAKWTYQTESITIRYGLSPRAELWWYAEYHQARLVNEDLGTNTKDSGVGDPRFGYRFALYNSEAPVLSVAIESEMKFPAGKESPGTYIGGPLNVSSFVFSTGTTDWYAGFAAKTRFGPIGLTGRVGYNRRFSGVVQYLIEQEQNQFVGRIAPGDQLLLRAEVMAQLGPLVLAVEPQFEYRAATRIGTSSGGLFPARNLEKVEGSSGKALDVAMRGVFQVNRGLDLEVYGV